MDAAQTGDGWTVEVVEGVMVWEFLPGIALSAFEDGAYPVFERLLATHEPCGLVTVVALEDPFDDRVHAVWERTARRASVSSIERWAVVAEGIKAISLRSTVRAPGLETTTTEDRTAAVEWARAGQ